MKKTCLTIAGLDPSGGAGIIADIKTFSAFGCYAAAAVSSITFQNTKGVFGAVHQSAETVRRQIEPVLDETDIAAVKTGMLPTREIIEEVAMIIQNRKLKNVVVDPVVRSTSGFDLIDDEALKALIEKLFPLADVVTPNLPEAERIAGMKIDSVESIEKAAAIMRSMGARNVLIKGGHIPISDFRLQIADSATRKATDYLFIGDTKQIFEADFIETTATHGTGCTLASAITGNLALGENLPDSIRIAKDFVSELLTGAQASCLQRRVAS